MVIYWRINEGKKKQTRLKPCQYGNWRDEDKHG